MTVTKATYRHFLQKDGTRTLCFFNQSCTRPDCPFLHTGTITSPATAHPDKETALTEGLTPRDAKTATKPDTAAVPPKRGTATPAVTAGEGPRKPVRPQPQQQQKKKGAVPELMPLRTQPRKKNGAGSKEGNGEAPRQGFVKSFEEIMKEKNEEATNAKKKQSSPPANANTGSKRAPPQEAASQKAKPTAGRAPIPSMSAKRAPTREAAKKRQPNSGQKSASPSAQTTAPRVNFVKSLDELMQQREGTGPAKTPKAAAVSGVKRPREEAPPTSKAASPQKHAKPTPPPEDEFDVEQELNDIGADDIDANGDDVPLDDELKELLGE